MPLKRHDQFYGIYNLRKGKIIFYEGEDETGPPLLWKMMADAVEYKKLHHPGAYVVQVKITQNSKLMKGPGQNVKQPRKKSTGQG